MSEHLQRLDELTRECEALVPKLRQVSKRSAAVDQARCQSHLALLAQYSERCYGASQALRTLDLLQAAKSQRQRRLLKTDLEKFGGVEATSEESVQTLVHTTCTVIEKAEEFFRENAASIRPLPEKTDVTARLHDLELEREEAEQERLAWELLSDYEHMQSLYCEVLPVAARGEYLVRLRGCRELIEEMLLFRDQRSPTKFLQFASLPKREIILEDLIARCIEFFQDALDQESIP